MGKAGSSRGRRPSVRVCALISSSYEGTSHAGSGPTLLTSFHLNYLFQDPVSKHRHIGS